MYTTIIDCYTDEPAGLGVPPYLGVYPRYIAGSIKDEVFYLTIDDLRLYKLYNSKIPKTRPSEKTDIRINNLSKNYQNVAKILARTSRLIVVAGAHTPGKYLSAVPGTLPEIIELTKDVRCKKMISGPAATGFGTSFVGGKVLSKNHIRQLLKYFDDTFIIEDNYKKLAKIAVRGAKIASQLYNPFIAEIETSHGCPRKPGCSFCTDALKHPLEFRNQDDIISEIKALFPYTKYFRLGKQSCFFSYKNGNPLELEKLLKPIARLNPKVLHIDNVNPCMVNDERTKIVVKYCTSANVAALGVESFDEKVIKANNLNSTPDTTINAIKILNKYGKRRGENGMPRLLPGINILLGLIGESKETLTINLDWLKKIRDHGLWLRRINIRQVVPYLGTELYNKCGIRYLKRNMKYYWKFRYKVRHEVDLPMLRRIVPKGTIIKDVRTEIYHGNTTFARQLGSYPLIIGINMRVPLNKFFSVKVTGHMLRSITAEII